MLSLFFLFWIVSFFRFDWVGGCRLEHVRGGRGVHPDEVWEPQQEARPEGDLHALYVRHRHHQHPVRLRRRHRRRHQKQPQRLRPLLSFWLGFVCFLFFFWFPFPTQTWIDFSLSLSSRCERSTSKLIIIPYFSSSCWMRSSRIEYPPPFAVYVSRLTFLFEKYFCIFLFFFWSVSTFRSPLSFYLFVFFFAFLYFFSSLFFEILRWVWTFTTIDDRWPWCRHPGRNQLKSPYRVPPHRFAKWFFFFFLPKKQKKQTNKRNKKEDSNAHPRRRRFYRFFFQICYRGFYLLCVFFVFAAAAALGRALHWGFT